MKTTSLRMLLIAVLVGTFGSLAFASAGFTGFGSDAQTYADQGEDANAADRCRRPGVDCTWDALLTAVESRYGVSSLPALAPPTANYVNAQQVDNLVYVSSAGPELLVAPGGFYKNELPAMTVAEAQNAATLSCVRGLRFLKSVVGDLDRVEKIVMVKGNVNITPTYDDVTSGPVVGALGRTVDGCSNFLVEVFGAERGKHARATGGAVQLPFNMATEIEMIVELKY